LTSACGLPRVGAATPTSVISERSSRTAPTPISPKPTRDSMVVVLSEVLDEAAAANRTADVVAAEVDPLVRRL
jgi:hypothetical protein